jgi:tripartite-type tricarboxylate transporter receptor subunit TctC
MGWFAAMVPAATPRPIVDKLNGWFNTVLKTEDAKKFLNTYGGDPFISTPDEGQALMRKTIKEWESYVEIAGIEKQ